MDKYVMDIRLENWIPIFEAQARSGLNKQTFCKQNGISRDLFFKWQRIFRKKVAEGLDPNSITIPAEIKQSNKNHNEDGPVFYELSTSTQNDLNENANDRNKKYLSPVIDTPEESCAISIFYESFTIKLSGKMDESSLTSVIRAIKNA